MIRPWREDDGRTMIKPRVVPRPNVGTDKVVVPRPAKRRSQRDLVMASLVRCPDPEPLGHR